MRLLVGLITGTWLAFFPVYLFVIYMFHEQFFSYEFFSDGIFGLKTFLFVLLILMVMLSAYLWGFLAIGRMATIEYEKKEKYGQYHLWTHIFIILSILFHFCFYLVGDENKVASRLPPLSILGFVLMLTIASSIGSNILKKLSNWIPSVLFIFASATLPALFHDITADLVSVALKTFNVGGGVTAKIVRLDDAKTVIHEGKLLLLTPKNAYFREGERGYRVIQQSENVSIVVSYGKK